MSVVPATQRFSRVDKLLASSGTGDMKNQQPGADAGVLIGSYCEMPKVHRPPLPDWLSFCLPTPPHSMVEAVAELACSARLTPPPCRHMHAGALA